MNLNLVKRKMLHGESILDFGYQEVRFVTGMAPDYISLKAFITGLSVFSTMNH